MEVPSSSSEIPKRHSLTVSSESESETVKLSDSRSTSPQLPHKAPKKVSFSDELPQETPGTSSGTPPPDATLTQKSESVKLSHCDVNPFVFMLQQNDSYLNNLHQMDPPPPVVAPLANSDVFPNERRSSIHGPDESETANLDSKPPASILKPSDPVSKPPTTFDPISAGLVNDLKTQRDLVDAALAPAGKKNNLADSDKIEKSVLGGTEVMPPVVSAMELEVKRDKRRWLLISELSAIFGEEKHSVDGFKRIFREQVSFENPKFSAQRAVRSDIQVQEIETFKCVARVCIFMRN